MASLITPKQAAAEMGISTATITRARKRGAPVHPWGSTGKRYRINIAEFVEWMERQGDKHQQISSPAQMNVHAMAMARRAEIRNLSV